MNLQENVQRIREMMGLITENIDDLLDKMSRGEELSKDEKDKMELYSKHIKSGGTDQDFNYEPQVDTQESNDVDYNVLIEKLLYEIINNRYKDYFYIKGVKERIIHPSIIGLMKVGKSLGSSENENDDDDDINPKELNQYIMVGYTDKGLNFPRIVAHTNLLNSEKKMWCFPNWEHYNFKRNVKSYIDTKANQSIKDLYNSNKGPLYDFGENDYKVNKPIIYKVFVKWFNDKFGESFSVEDIYGWDIGTEGTTTSQLMFFDEYVKENGFDGYIKDL
jgi:hypothetical protein